MLKQLAKQNHIRQAKTLLWETQIIYNSGTRNNFDYNKSFKEYQSTGTVPIKIVPSNKKDQVQGFKEALTQNGPQSLSFQLQFKDQFQEEHSQDTQYNKWLLWLFGYEDQRTKLLQYAQKIGDIIYSRSTDVKYFKVFQLPLNGYSAIRLMNIHEWLVYQRLLGERPAGVSEQVRKTFKQNIRDELLSSITNVKNIDHDLKHYGTAFKKDIDEITYGLWLAMDQKLLNEERLARTLLRNIYNNDKDKMPYAELLEHYMSREYQCLFDTPIEDIYQGNFLFSQYFEDEGFDEDHPKYEELLKSKLYNKVLDPNS